jgi:hypothetical protein
MTNHDYELEAKGLRLVATHINKVQYWMSTAIGLLLYRSTNHDQSKYSQDEIGLVIGKPAFDKYEYMSKEERGALAGVQDALVHHYANNSHHPEHFKNFKTYECGGCYTEFTAESEGKKCAFCGYDIFEQPLGINGMSLFDLIEMCCDWKAAGEMSPNGSFANSLEYNEKRFGLSPQLVQILENTGREMGWID